MRKRGIVIESNHQRSVAVVIDHDRIHEPTTGQSLNHHTGITDDVYESYVALLYHLASSFADGTIENLSSVMDFAVVCLPGGATDTDSNVVRSIFVRTGWKNLSSIYVVDDTWAAAVSVGPDTIVGIADAGSSVFVNTGQFPAGRVAKFDGWGPLLGDFGGTLQLAIDTLRLCCRYLDRGEPLPILAAILKTDKDMSQAKDLQQWFDGIMNKQSSIWLEKLSSVGQTIIEKVAESPGEHFEVHQLIEKSAWEFSETLEIAYKAHLPISKNMRIVVYGCMSDLNIFYRYLQKALADKQLCAPTKHTKTVFYGALLFSYRTDKLWTNAPLPFDPPLQGLISHPTKQDQESLDELLASSTPAVRMLCDRNSANYGEKARD